MLWAMERDLNDTNPDLAAKVRALRRDIATHCGVLAPLSSAVLGPVLAVGSAPRDQAPGRRQRATSRPTFLERANWSEA